MALFHHCGQPVTGDLMRHPSSDNWSRNLLTRILLAAMIASFLVVVPVPTLAYAETAVVERRPVTLRLSATEVPEHDHDHDHEDEDEDDALHRSAVEPLAMVSDVVERFEMIGLSLARAPRHPVLVRTGRGDVFESWTELPFSADHAEETSAEGLTEAHSDPLWVDHADRFEFALHPDDATDAVVNLVRTERRRRVVDDTPAAGSTPSIRSRSSWGARPAADPHDYADDLKVGIVHHTAGSNGYTASQVPGILRGIQAFHMDVRGWDDIAYNFAVDRFGQIWEARGGGIDRIVTGGHSRGFNTGSVGVAVLGDYDSASAGSAIVSGVARVLAWKFALHDVDPSTSVPFTAGSDGTKYDEGTTLTLPRIIGHRDVSSTSCPGASLYPLLGSIRREVARLFPGEIAQQPAHLLVGDYDGDSRKDAWVYRPHDGSDGVWRGRPTGFAKVLRSVRGVYDPIAGDFDGDGRDDMYWNGSGSQPDSIWFSGHPAGSKALTSNGSYHALAGDFDGDADDDLFLYAFGPASDALLRGSRTRQFVRTTHQVSGYYRPFTGDFDGDGRDDIYWYGPGSHVDSIWFGRADGGFDHVSRRVSGHYEPFVGDFDGDDRDDVYWYAPGPAPDSIWFGSPARTFSPKTASVRGYYQPLVGDFDGSDTDDIIWYRSSGGTAAYWRFTSSRTFSRNATSTYGGVTPLVGDFSGDGLDDVLWYADRGTDHTSYGLPTGGFATFRVG